MATIDRKTGKLITSRREELHQSVADILTTRLITRHRRSLYGSDLPNLFHGPINDRFIVRGIAAIADAIARWEKRVRLETVNITAQVTGRVDIAYRMIDREFGTLISGSISIREAA